MVVMNDN